MIQYSRKSHRLKDFDYSSNRGYFITICSKNRLEHFGEIKNGKILLTEIGKIIEQELFNMNKDNIILDSFTIMPDHIHFIIIIMENQIEKNESDISCTANSGIGPTNTDIGPTNTDIDPTETDIDPTSIESIPSQNNIIRRKMIIPKIIGKFKMITSKQFNILNQTPGTKNLWQSNYYDHIIRDEYELKIIRKYILNNPLKRELQKNNPENLYR